MTEMQEFKSVDEILDYAIEREQEAADFYTELAAKMDRKAMRKVFEDFAGEELGHKVKLKSVKEGKLLMPAEKKVMDLKIARYVEEPEEVSSDMDYQDALQIAMQREKRSYKLYTDLASVTDDENIKKTFLALAQEEAKHKLRFEIEYDENILTEN